MCDISVQLSYCIIVCSCFFAFSLLDVFSEPAKSLLCRGSNEITLNLVFEYVAQDLAQHIEASASSTTVFSETYIKVIMFWLNNKLRTDLLTDQCP